MGRLRLISGGAWLLALAAGTLATNGCCGLGEAIGRAFVLMAFELDHLSSPWSPEGDRVLIGGGWSALASVDVASGDTTELAGPGVVMASFSPDGRSILCAGLAGEGSMGLWIESADGGERTMLVEAREDGDLASAWGTWSPDGRWIALSGFLELVRPDLTERRSLFTGGGGWLAWSPDGRWIACYGVDESPRGYGLHVVAADGGERRRIGDGMLPSWSPDGGRLAFVGLTEDGMPGGVRVVDASGKNARFLCEGTFPRWSPREDEILVQRYENARGRLFVVAADGSGERMLALGNTAWWSPDGSLVSLYRDNELFLVNADGSGERSLGRVPSGSFPKD